MAESRATWVVDEQQNSYVERVFDLMLHPEPVPIALADIDTGQSLTLGQNRLEMSTDEETVQIIAMYLEEGVAMPMPLVWKRDNRQRKVVVLDGNHRIEAALRTLGEPTCLAQLVTGEASVAQNLAVMINTLHGRSSRNPEYVAQAMRLLREREIPVATIARMFGVSDERVRVMTKRDEQNERIGVLVPNRTPGKIPLHTLDVVGHLEDEHLRVLGSMFLDAPAKIQRDIVDRIRAAPSGLRDDLAHEAVGELRVAREEKHKVRAPNSATTILCDAMSRLRKVTNPINAYHRATVSQQAVLRSNMAEVMPRVQKLWASVIGEQT